MNDKVFFEDIIKAVPKRSYSSGAMSGIADVLDAGQIELLNGSLQTEINRLRFYLINKSSQDREIIIEWITNELLHAYYETREIMNLADVLALKSNIIRVMNVIYGAIIMVILLSEEIRVEYRSGFITGWINRITYFPFENLMTGSNNSMTQGDALYFSGIVTESTCLELLNSLIDGQFIGGGTPIGDIMCWFGGSNNVAANRINWVSTLKDLNAFINTFYPNEAKKWDKAVSCFTQNGNDIKKKSLSTAISTYDADPESKGVFEKIRKSIR